MTITQAVKKARSAYQESRFATLIGGILSPGSGSGWRKPNDVRTDKHLVEMKRTDGVSISVRIKDWNQLRTNSLLEGRVPIMHLEMGGYSGETATSPNSDPVRLVAMAEDDWLEISGYFV